MGLAEVSATGNTATGTAARWELGMRGAPRRWSRTAALVGGLVLLCAGCSNQIAGEAAPPAIPTLTPAHSVSQAVRNFGGAGPVHSKGKIGRRWGRERG